MGEQYEHTRMPRLAIDLFRHTHKLIAHLKPRCRVKHETVIAISRCVPSLRPPAADSEPYTLRARDTAIFPFGKYICGLASENRSL